jgi:protein gp37
VFCASLADVFDNQVDPLWRTDLFALIRATPHLVWLLLTKRPENIIKMAEAAGGLPWNAALGATVEDQERADKRIPALLRAKAKLTPLFVFLSCEPMIGAISLRWAKWDNWKTPGGKERGEVDHLDGARVIEWIIVGGESGANARPMNPAWARQLRDECAEAGVAFHFKQWGEWSPHTAVIEQDDGTIKTKPKNALGWRAYVPGGIVGSFRVGKKAAGRLLDGVEHNGFPTAEAHAP